MVTYYGRDHAGHPIALARVVYDPKTGSARGFYANRRTATWIPADEMVGRATGAGGDADYYVIDRRTALDRLARLGVTGDDLDEEALDDPPTTP